MSFGQNLLDVFVSLLVLDPGGVGVGQLVDKAKVRGPIEDRGQVHLLDHGASVLDPAPRNHLQALRLRGGLLAVVRLEVADHDVTPRRLLGVALLQHAVGLADARPAMPRKTL